MPIYEYECVPAGHIFDRLQKLSEADPERCEVCGAGPVRRRVTAPSFRLAGSGWYETDFKGDKDKRRNLAGDNAGDSKGDSKVDNKPEGGKADNKSESSSTAASSSES